MKKSSQQIPAEHNIIIATYQFLSCLDVKVTKTTVKRKLLSHPDYLSLLSVTDCLRSLNVESYAAKVSFDELRELPCPILAYFEAEHKFVTITNVHSASVEYLDEYGKKQHLLQKAFLHLWSGVVMVAEANEKSGEPGYRDTRIRELVEKVKLPILFSLLFILAILRIYDLSEDANIYLVCYGICSILGIITTSFILLYEHDSQSTLLQQLCSTSAKTNCSAVLNSGASTILGNIRWSDIGLVYFVASYGCLLVGGSSVLPLFTTFSFCSLPIIVFFIYYQRWVVKQWCMLCLLTHCILLVGFVITVVTPLLSHQRFANPTSIEFASLRLFVFCFSLTAIVWYFLKPYLTAKQKVDEVQYEIDRFKNNKEVFSSVLRNGTPLLHATTGLGITLGNRSASNTLVKVCNPYCRPCAQRHFEIDTLIHNNPEWQVQVIFVSNGIDQDIRTITVSHLMAIDERSQEENNEHLKIQALKEWYELSNKKTLLPDERYATFAKRYPLNGELKRQYQKVQAMHEWCEKMGITHTPTCFVNGFRLPEQYSINDLANLG